MNREIKASEAVMRARKTVFTGLSQYRIPYSRELEGKYFKLVFDNGTIVILTFPARNAVEIQINDEKRLSEDAYVQKAEEGAYLVMTEIAGSSPRTAYMFVIDTFEKLVTAITVWQGKDKARPDLVTREIMFGAIKEGDRPLPDIRHKFTKDLWGKKINWTYTPEVSVIHVYLKNNCFTYALDDEMKKRMEEGLTAGKFREPEKKPYYEENCYYVKLRENLYLFSWVAENASGHQGLHVINTDRVHSAGCFWGTSPEGEKEGYMFNSYGFWERAHIAEDDLLENI